MRALLGAPTNRMQGFLAAGHVCTVMGYEEYEPIAAHYRVPIVVTGFVPPPNTKRWVVRRKAAVRSAVRSHHYRAGLPSLRAFRGEVPVMAARSKPMAFRGCAPLAFRLTVADPNYQRSIWSSRTTRSWPSVSLLMRY
jgi:hypothetical protein